MPFVSPNPSKTLRRAVLALQLLPLVALTVMGVTFQVDYPVRGIMPWLETSHGIAHHVYPSILFFFAGVYSFGLWRFYAIRKRHTTIVLAMASAGVPLSAHAAVVLYYQTRINPGASMTGTMQWILIALFVYVIAWFAIALQERIWEIEMINAHPTT